MSDFKQSPDFMGFKGTAPSVLDAIESYAIQKRKADKRKRDAEYRARNREKINAKKRAWWAAHRGERRAWWAKHKEELNARQRKRYAQKKAEKQKQAPKKEVFIYENP